MKVKENKVRAPS